MQGSRSLKTSGAALRAARVLAGMTQRELATAASLHPKSIAYWERKGSRGRYG
jgi:transcriptional regulator with XRE-family HTH domain